MLDKIFHNLNVLYGVIWTFLCYFLVLFLTGVEFCQKVIGAIVNLPTIKRRTLRGSMDLFEGVFVPFF